MPGKTYQGTAESAFAAPSEQSRVSEDRRWTSKEKAEAMRRAESTHSCSDGSTAAPDSSTSGSPLPDLPKSSGASLAQTKDLPRTFSVGLRRRSEGGARRAKSHPIPPKAETPSTSYVTTEDGSTSFIRDARLYLAISSRPQSAGRDGPLTLLSKLRREEQDHSAIKDPGWQLHLGQESIPAGSAICYGRTMKLKASRKGWNPPDLREWKRNMDRIFAVAYKRIPDLWFKETNTYIEILFNVRNHHEHALKMQRLFQAVLKFEWHIEAFKDQIIDNDPSSELPKTNHSQNPHISHLSLPYLFTHLNNLFSKISNTEDITHIYRTLNERGPHPNPLVYNWHICQNLGEKIRVYATEPLASSPATLEKWMSFVFSFVNAAVHCPKERLMRYADTKEGLERFLVEGETRGSCTLGSGPRGMVTGSSAALDVVQGLNELNTLDRVYTSHPLWYGCRASDRNG